MAINLNPANIANAGLYNTSQLTASSLKTCKAPPEGFKVVPLQVNYKTKPGQFITLGTNAAGPIISQIAAIYVDNSQSTHSITLIFPDTNYQVNVAFGAQKMVPVLSSEPIPNFYCMLDNAGATNATDVTNLFLLNQFMPEFSSGEDFFSTQQFGIGPGGQLFPFFSQGNAFTTLLGGSGAAFDQSVNVLIATQWYLSLLDCSVMVQNEDGGVGQLGISFSDIGQIYFQFYIPVTPAFEYTKVCSLNNMSIVSDSQGPLIMTAGYVNSQGVPGNIKNIQLSCNIYGGILTP